MVYIHGHYVYVTDCDSYKISVFTTEGEYVTSFAEKEDFDMWRDFVMRGVCVKDSARSQAYRARGIGSHAHRLGLG